MRGCTVLIPLADADRPTCGGKAGALGDLVRAGLPVPDGFVVPVAAHRGSDAPGDRPVPPDLHATLTDALHALGDVPVAVRSSAGHEDGTHASAAGQHATVLGVRDVADVVDAVRACWTSLHAPGAVAYRAATTGPGHPVMGVLVQRLVDADIAGVLFTRDDGTVLIEASWGLGATVVGGTVTPDAHRVQGDGTVTRTVADKRTRADRVGTRIVVRDVPDGDRLRPALDDATAVRLADLGRRAADLLGAPQDVEWAVADGTAWVLQARPVTSEPPTDAPAAAARALDGGAPDGVATDLLTGTPGSRGTATGPARVVHGPADFARVRRGDVLVCRWTDPSWTALLHLAAGVVTETGGVLSHAAIVARERGIPAVLGVAHATTALADGSTLQVDGTTGTVGAPGTPRT
ncbi:PEP/pyruvate-binding domain-containing protein [Cellulomonas wangleii]|uniref:PEP/pyruvate-binding domain-containing protein n=1 Tax=Cellulomonas wangleii TaxID=2816956 RepID=UPI0020BF2CC4|nr:PEP/pyruvate-binding domain-containing protein [Cellulomonas wangleii]